MQAGIILLHAHDRAPQQLPLGVVVRDLPLRLQHIMTEGTAVGRHQAADCRVQQCVARPFACRIPERGSGFVPQFSPNRTAAIVLQHHAPAIAFKRPAKQQLLAVVNGHRNGAGRGQAQR